MATRKLDPSTSAADDLDQVAELDRRWAAIEAGEATIPHEEVVRWLETWGTPAFRPWRDRQSAQSLSNSGNACRLSESSGSGLVQRTARSGSLP